MARIEGARATAARATLALGTGVAVVLPFVAGARWDGYDLWSQYISELGAQGAPDGTAVSVGFVAIGLLLLAGTALLAGRSRTVWPSRVALLGVVAVGGGLGGSYAITGVARCDAGCPEAGAVSTTQQVHNLVGATGYVLAVVGLVGFGLAARRAPRWRPIAWVGLALAPALAAASAVAAEVDDLRGLAQRVLEAGAYAWLLAIAWRATTRSRPADGDPVEMDPTGVSPGGSARP